ncbi:hypothetical protein AAIH26_35035, partial [Pseudomonas aeruginosa]
GVGATAAALVDLSTVAGNKISNPPWVKFQSAGWVNFPSAPTEWVPSTGYLTAQEAQRDISHYLMHRYNWIRPHQFNDGLPPAVAEEKLNPLSGMG